VGRPTNQISLRAPKGKSWPAYRERHSTCKALTILTDDWLKEIDEKEIVGGVLLDIIDHNLLLKKLVCYSSDIPVGLSSVLSTSEQSVGSQSLLCSHSKYLEVVSHSALLKYLKPEGGSSVVWRCMSVGVAL
jgi:hypothetical protein